MQFIWWLPHIYILSQTHTCSYSVTPLNNDNVVFPCLYVCMYVFFVAISLHIYYNKWQKKMKIKIAIFFTHPLSEHTNSGKDSPLIGSLAVAEVFVVARDVHAVLRVMLRVRRQEQVEVADKREQICQLDECSSTWTVSRVACICK